MNFRLNWNEFNLICLGYINTNILQISIHLYKYFGNIWFFLHASSISRVCVWFHRIPSLNRYIMYIYSQLFIYRHRVIVSILTWIRVIVECVATNIVENLLECPKSSFNIEGSCVRKTITKCETLKSDGKDLCRIVYYLFIFLYV